jgi:hypothetical protein
VSLSTLKWNQKLNEHRLRTLLQELTAPVIRLSRTLNSFGADYGFDVRRAYAGEIRLNGELRRGTKLTWGKSKPEQPERYHGFDKPTSRLSRLRTSGP